MKRVPQSNDATFSLAGTRDLEIGALNQNQHSQHPPHHHPSASANYNHEYEYTGLYTIPGQQQHPQQQQQDKNTFTYEQSQERSRNEWWHNNAPRVFVTMLEMVVSIAGFSCSLALQTTMCTMFVMLNMSLEGVVFVQSIINTLLSFTYIILVFVGLVRTRSAAVGLIGALVVALNLLSCVLSLVYFFNIKPDCGNPPLERTVLAISIIEALFLFLWAIITLLQKTFV